MSSLSNICDYGSSDESDGDSLIIKNKEKLPAPNLSKVVVISTEDYLDDPSLHRGRERLFPHKRGDWATYIYISNFEITDLVNRISSVVSTLDDSFEICEDFHISLSRTFVLKYHQITSFTRTLKHVLEEVERFDICFDSVKVYTNENKSRTFVSLGVDFFADKYLKKTVDKIDKVLLEYNLPVFYNDPSFHMSFMWSKGDKKDKAEIITKNLNEIILDYFEKNITNSVTKINCKSGNKTFQYFLA